MKKRKKLSKILSYIYHYGLISTVSLAYEKLVSDKKRFAPKEKIKSLHIFNADSGRACEAPNFTDAPLLPKARILYLIHYFYPERKGGTERFTFNIANEMKARGSVPIVLVLDANLPMRDYTFRHGDILFREYEYSGIKCIGFRHKKAPRGLFYKAITEDDADMRAFLRFLAEKLEIDIVHATYPQPFAPMLAECRALGIPYIVTCTDFAMICHYATMVDKNGEFCTCPYGGERCSKTCKSLLCRDFGKRYKAAKSALLGASAVTAPSGFVRKMISREFPELDIITVGHGISDEFKEEKPRSAVKSFLYAGTLSPLKGVHLLLSAFARLEGDFELIIAGAGDEKYKKMLMKTADARVRFIGAIPAEKMPELYSNADCVIVPSMWYETYNFVLREAQKTGALVIASNIGAMPEAITEGENGFLFEPCCEDSLLDAIMRAAEFDFSNYKRSAYPRISDEADIYTALMAVALEKNKKS